MNPLDYKLKQKKTNNINIILKNITTTSTILCASIKIINWKWLILKVKQILVFKKHL